MLAESTEKRAERNPSLDPASDDDWQRLVAMLPVDVDAMAIQSKAIIRRRLIRSGQVLLRLILIYVLCSLSLRDTASWAARALAVMLTDEALGSRFANATPFVQELARTMLAARLHEKPVAGAALRLLDATVLTVPGSVGTDWRVHVTYDPTRAEIVGVEVTDAHGGEHVRRAATTPGDLLIADMGLGHASDVREGNRQQIRVLLRAHLQTLAVDDLQHRRMTPEQLLDAADLGPLDRDVLLPEHGHETVPARLVLLPLPPEQAGRARQRLRKAKKGHAPSELALRHAGYFCCVTTLTKEEASTEALLAWYRVRWQVEIDQPWCAPSGVVYISPLPSPVAPMRDLPQRRRHLTPGSMTARSFAKERAVRPLPRGVSPPEAAAAIACATPCAAPSDARAPSCPPG